MPLVKLDSILGDVGAERSGAVSVKSVALRELGLVVNAIWLHEALEVSPRFEELVTELVHN